MIFIKYIETTQFSAHISIKQREYIEKIKSKLEKSAEIKIPLSEIVRMALDAGLPIVEKNKSGIIELLKK